MDHDQRFKHMLREFFREFMELFFAVWAARLNFAEWKKGPRKPSG